MASMIAYRGQYRVLVLRSAEDSNVYAVCLEQNLVGYGPDFEAAVSDLSRVLTYAMAHELTDNAPAYRADPDPELDAVYRDKSRTETTEGDLVIQRLTGDFLFELEEKKPTKPVQRARKIQRIRRRHRVTYSDSESPRLVEV
jgi:hypothetical protein